MILDSFSLAGKTALVTGASSGIGQAIAIALGEAGAGVAVHCRQAGNAVETIGKIKNSGGNVVEVFGEMSEKFAAQNVFDQAVETLGSVDILINNAGTIRRSPAVEYSEEDWQTV